MDKLKWMTLLYVAVNRESVVQTLMDGAAPCPEDYYIARRMPLVEMLSKDPTSMMEELIAMTASAEWQTQFRRPISAGDVLCFGEDPWMLIDTGKELKIGLKVTPLPAHKKYGITPMQQQQFKEFLCKPKISAT
jgi:hypothetical protein